MEEREKKILQRTLQAILLADELVVLDKRHPGCGRTKGIFFVSSVPNAA